MDIGRRIYEGEIDRYQVAEEYCINDYTARDYMRLYRDTYQLPHIKGNRKAIPKTSNITKQSNLQEYQDMSKEELIQARIAEAQYKKGSIIFCSQFDVPGWRDKIGSPIIADTICDRIVHDSYRIVIECEESMRKIFGVNQSDT